MGSSCSLSPRRADSWDITLHTMGKGNSSPLPPQAPHSDLQRHTPPLPPPSPSQTRVSNCCCAVLCSCILHIIDMDPSSVSANGWLEDTSKVDKYEMSDEAYNKRENTFRKYKEEKLKADPTWSVQKEMAMRRGEEYVPPAKVEDPEHMADEASAINAGDRCETYPGGNRGEVKWVPRDASGHLLSSFRCPPRFRLPAISLLPGHIHAKE